MSIREIEAWTPEGVPFDAELRGVFADNAIELDTVDIKLGDAKIRATAEVLLQPDFELEGLSIDASGPRLSDIGRLGSWELRNKPFRVRAKARSRGSRTEINGFLFEAGNNDLRGDLILTEDETDYISLEVRSDNLNLDEIRTRVDTNEDAQTTVDSGTAGKSVFNDDPLPFDLLRDINADATVNINNLVAEGRVFNNVSLQATLKDGRLNLERGELGSSSGELSIQGSVAPVGDSWVVIANFEAQSLSLELKDMTAEEIAALPRFAIDSEVSLTGNTTRELAQSANGYFWALGGEGQIRRMQMGILTGDFISELLNTLNPFAKQSDS